MMWFVFPVLSFHTDKSDDPNLTVSTREACACQIWIQTHLFISFFFINGHCSTVPAGWHTILYYCSHRATSLIYTAVAHIRCHLAASHFSTPSWPTGRILTILGFKCINHAILLWTKTKPFSTEKTYTLEKEWKFAKVNANKPFSMTNAILQCKIHPVRKHKPRVLVRLNMICCFLLASVMLAHCLVHFYLYHILSCHLQFLTEK